MSGIKQMMMGVGGGDYAFINITISANTNDYNLRTAFVNAGWNQTKPLFATVTINPGVVIGSTSVASQAFDTGTNYPAGSIINIVNNGYIIGRGGNGGTATSSGSSAGTAGGLGLFARTPISITNNGVIGGGGGGGGAGEGKGFYVTNTDPYAGTTYSYYYAGGGGGGGGAAYGSGGGGDTTITTGYKYRYATSGGTGGTSGGAGGASSYGSNGPNDYMSGGSGGNGGNPGQAGSPGGGGGYGAEAGFYPTPFQWYPPTAGGAAGNAVNGNSNISWVVTGNVAGAVINGVPAPIANFSISSTTGTSPASISFTDTSSGTPTSWSWNFGDGGTSTQQNPTYVYNTAGTYTVTLTVSNSGGTTSKSMTNVVTISAPPTYNFAPTISSNTLNYNVYSAAIAAGWNGTTPLSATITIGSGVYVGSSSTSSFAFDTGTSIPSGSSISLINNGTIYGMGGAGGTGGNGDVGSPGSPGGPALRAQVALSVTNNGTIAGGGGGGGGGGTGSFSPSEFVVATGVGGGGGGGGGLDVGSGGTAGGGFTGGTVTSSQSGSLTSGGAGGNGNGASTPWGSGGGGTGGTGGAPGFPGQAGQSGTGPGAAAAGGAGGAVGAAVNGNANITWVSTGTRLGTIA